MSYFIILKKKLFVTFFMIVCEIHFLKSVKQKRSVKEWRHDICVSKLDRLKVWSWKLFNYKMHQSTIPVPRANFHYACDNDVFVWEIFFFSVWKNLLKDEDDERERLFSYFIISLSSFFRSNDFHLWSVLTNPPNCCELLILTDLDNLNLVMVVWL